MGSEKTNIHLLHLKNTRPYHIVVQDPRRLRVHMHQVLLPAVAKNILPATYRMSSNARDYEIGEKVKIKLV